MTSKLLTAFALCLVLSCPTAASPIVLSGSSAWNVATGSDFWANPSYDRNGVAHVGIFLTGTPGSNVPNFYANSPHLTELTYLGTGATTFRWDVDYPPYEQLISVTAWTDAIGIEAGVLRLVTPYRTWRSDTLDQGRSHFAVFDAPGFYYIGMEDATWDTPRTADWDYNDLIIRIPKTQVPEGGATLGLLGMTLLGLAWWRRAR